MLLLREVVEKIQESQEEAAAAATIASDSGAEYVHNTDAQQVELVDQITMPCEATNSLEALVAAWPLYYS
eukprot:scaffold5219_cov148-Skeletonema_dohrnii-CCMP3373.AAC.10